MIRRFQAPQVRRRRIRIVLPGEDPWVARPGARSRLGVRCSAFAPPRTFPGSSCVARVAVYLMVASAGFPFLSRRKDRMRIALGVMNLMFVVSWGLRFAVEGRDLLDEASPPRFASRTMKS